MQKRTITRKDSPVTDAPYSPAVVWGLLVFVSGQIPMDPKTNVLFSGGFAEEAELTFENLKRVLEESGSSLDNVLKTTAFLTNMDNFAELNLVYKRYFPKDRPARSCVEVSHLPLGARLEIEAVAAISADRPA